MGNVYDDLVFFPMRQGFLTGYGPPERRDITLRFIEEAAAYLKTVLPAEFQEEFRRVATTSTQDLIPYHFSWGLDVRNLLRRGGFTDSGLPFGNWDDYYMMTVGLGVGILSLRDIEEADRGAASNGSERENIGK